MRRLLGAAAMVSALAVSHVAAAEEAGDAWDPIEPINRTIFGINQFVELLLIMPFAAPYHGLAPDAMKAGVENVLDNLHAPVDLANDLLQGEMGRAWNTTQRFFINSTIGVLGIRDAAAEMGYPDHDEDFGQTLAVWGVPEGFYMVLPIFGPAYPRDGVGKVVDGYIDPWTYLWPNEALLARSGIDGMHEYASLMDELGQIRKSSIDYYAAIRSMYTQKRRAEATNGEGTGISPIPAYPDVSFDYDAPTAAPVADVPAQAATEQVSSDQAPVKAAAPEVSMTAVEETVEMPSLGSMVEEAPVSGSAR